MKILKISGRNLASLAGDFEVDFEQEPLASAGLFAISGPTGAGKTTLLDALCLALYDATPRMLRGGSWLPDVGATTVAAQDPRTLLRRGAAEGHAEVDFVGNDNLRYRARWGVRRSYKKASGALQPTSMTLHRLPELTALGGTKTEVAAEIVKCIGLTFDQFTRAVLLAQNEFSAFLKTDENDRGELLETLTGSAIYSAISKRAHERFKLEQQALQQLKSRLADHIPLSAEARCGLDAQAAAADADLALADARKAALEQELRWHQEAGKLRLNEAQAEQALAAASAARADAAARREQLALRESAETARPLHAEWLRLQREIASIETAAQAVNAQLAQARSAQADAGAALLAATAELNAAEQAQNAAIPMLDQAKALDASIATLAPPHAKARAQRDATQRERELAAKAVQEQTTVRQALVQEQARAAEWLTAHSAWEALARQWPRWDSLLTQAQTAAGQLAQARSEREAAQAASDSALLACSQSEQALAGSTQHLAALDAARQRTNANLAAIDIDQLRQEHQRLEARRADLQAADTRWTALAQAHASLAHAQEQAAALAGAGSAAAQALADASADAQALQAALQQSERSLQAAELACAKDVVELRSTLSDGEPCPVCGSAEHPYQHQQPALQGMLASLRAEVQRCRKLVQDNASAQAAQRALIARHEQQQASVARELALRQAERERTQAAWDACALAQEAPPQDERSEWFAQQNELTREHVRRLEEQEQTARDAARARDTAQQAYDDSAAAHKAAQERASAASAASTRATATLGAATERETHVTQHLAHLLEELEPVLEAEGRSAWQANPQRVRAQREDEVRQWEAQSRQHAERAARLAAIELELAGQQARAAQAEAAEQAARMEFAQLDEDITARRQQRAMLFEGELTADVERLLASAIAIARGTVAARQQASHEAGQAEVRLLESQKQLAARLDAVRGQAAGAAQALDAWLENAPAIASAAALAQLLALDHASLLAERAALQSIDEALTRATTVLAERRQQSVVHEQSRPAGDSSMDDLAAALAALDSVRRQALEAATGFKLQIAQDDERRRNSQAMMAEIDRQEQIELRWSRLNDLVGSADGKKFRNYAQQFTLDVLLGYANSHLQHLARRYRLERITTAAGPSLGLLVRDQDMGGEIRSVNSLSGGESFLVSLALALGLASLSSNRVRVESLFIDEGFGSLDSETLRVAMDALDGLQSMGRKVGVISHVQEMTERIATKVLVQPSGGGSSRVTVQ